MSQVQWLYDSFSYHSILTLFVHTYMMDEKGRVCWHFFYKVCFVSVFFIVSIPFFQDIVKYVLNRNNFLVNQSDLQPSNVNFQCFTWRWIKIAQVVKMSTHFLLAFLICVLDFWILVYLMCVYLLPSCLFTELKISCGGKVYLASGCGEPTRDGAGGV